MEIQLPEESGARPFSGIESSENTLRDRARFTGVAGVALAMLVCAAHAHAQGSDHGGVSAEARAALERGEWRTYAGTYASAKYSPLGQIDKSNASKLRVAWRAGSPDEALRRANPGIDPSWSNQGTPLMVGGTLM